jgi:hypothetical protein
LQGGEYAGQPITKEGRQRGFRESDDVVVPMKAGNAAGGKDVVSGDLKLYLIRRFENAVLFF